jgi:hypothetical protein
MSRRSLLTLSVLVAASLVGASAVQAQYAPVIVVPGRAGVPVTMNGYDVSWAVIEGDWGLARPGQVSPTIIYRLAPTAVYPPPAGPYYPSTGQPPRYGRLEVMPPANRPLPRPAQSFYRDWGTQSDMNAPVTTYPPFNPPEVIYGSDSDPRPRPRPKPRPHPHP